MTTEVADLRRRGYALDREENVPGLGCVAAPMRDLTGTVKYPISISTLTLEHTVDQIEAMAAVRRERARGLLSTPPPAAPRRSGQRGSGRPGRRFGGAPMWLASAGRAP